VSVENVKSMLDAGEEFLLLDVRKPEEYAIAHIPGARLIPLADLPAALEQLRMDADLPIVTHCHKGVRSLQAAAFLRQQGFDDVRSMAGGIDAWSERIDPTVPRY
jgi:sulfur-carrier protein adenylyltransferase/sulfurtransferase